MTPHMCLYKQTPEMNDSSDASLKDINHLSNNHHQPVFALLLQRLMKYTCGGTSTYSIPE
jgi:hypothetical protein